MIKIKKLTLKWIQNNKFKRKNNNKFHHVKKQNKQNKISNSKMNKKNKTKIKNFILQTMN